MLTSKEVKERPFSFVLYYTMIHQTFFFWEVRMRCHHRTITSRYVLFSIPISELDTKPTGYTFNILVLISTDSCSMATITIIFAVIYQTRFLTDRLLPSWTGAQLAENGTYLIIANTINDWIRQFRSIEYQSDWVPSSLWLVHTWFQEKSSECEPNA